MYRETCYYCHQREVHLSRKNFLVQRMHMTFAWKWYLGPVPDIQYMPRLKVNAACALSTISQRVCHVYCALFCQGCCTHQIPPPPPPTPTVAMNSYVIWRKGRGNRSRLWSQVVLQVGLQVGPTCPPLPASLPLHPSPQFPPPPPTHTPLAMNSYVIWRKGTGNRSRLWSQVVLQVGLQVGVTGGTSPPPPPQPHSPYNT